MKVWSEYAGRYFPDMQAMVNWVDKQSLVPFLSLAADVDKEASREIVVTRMVEETKQDEGRFIETFRQINVVAMRLLLVFFLLLSLMHAAPAAAEQRWKLPELSTPERFGNLLPGQGERYRAGCGQCRKSGDAAPPGRNNPQEAT